MREGGPSILVWSSLFPSARHPQAGVFVRERMFRVGQRLPLTVVSPQPWFPLQGLVRLLRPHFRPRLPLRETMDGVEVFRPRYLSFPGLFKSLDGSLMAVCSYPRVRRLHQAGRADVIDAHFTYPDGYAASRVATWLGTPVSITMRGTEVRQSRETRLRSRLLAALRTATRVFAVSDSLRRLGVEIGAPADRMRVVGNGVDAERFRAEPRDEARRALGLDSAARVLVTVGGLVERKGFHRVIACLPALLERHPDLHYLVVGSAGPEGDYSGVLRQQVAQLGLQERVHFLGALSTSGVCRALSAADVFVLATRNEGWANVLLEAMACGLPVVATDVGGNSEVVCRQELGIIVPFGDQGALESALDQALRRSWDRRAIREYAECNDWSERVTVLVEEFLRMAKAGTTTAGAER